MRQADLKTKNRYINILGAGSLLTPHLVKSLSLKGYHGKFLGRTQRANNTFDSTKFSWERLDVTQQSEWFPEDNSVAVSIIPLWLLPDFLPHLKPCRQLIVFSTTSIFSKNKSSDPKERNLAQKIIQAEKQIQNYCAGNDQPWTILRPTLIYNCQHDKNIAAIAKFIRKWKFFPIALPGNGLRQPVHADDLAVATLSIIDNKNAFNRSFNLGGGETLPYRKMVKRIFQSMSQQPLILPVPTIFPETGLKVSRLFLNSDYSPELFKRMNQDLNFDISDAQTAFGYNPMPFNPIFR
ncbi:MAG: NAD-dependent epimerase/dehydratase [Desulfobacterales bacterium]|nr:NAD-dependent epimerase/dehydratase [Desulfobacterales bacterium]